MVWKAYWCKDNFKKDVDVVLTTFKLWVGVAINLGRDRRQIWQIDSILGFDLLIHKKELVGFLRKNGKNGEKWGKMGKMGKNG